MRLAAAALITATQALVAPTPQKASTRLHGRANKLVIWDCDGVLVDSEALLKQAEVDALVDAGFEGVTTDDCNRLFSGFAPEAGAANFLEEYGKPLPEGYFEAQIANSLQLFRDKLVALNGDTVLALDAAGRKQVVASGSPRDRVDVCLVKAGIDGVFGEDRVFTREDVPGRGKPEPDIFLKAAKHCGFEPKDCVVVEDSTSGMRAAAAADMECVAYLGGGHAQKDWYLEKIAAFGIPITYSAAELLACLNDED
jgi:HAD superfamily hydrolase (TIGR01509 family)